jgi:hypothetical protein
MQLWATMQSLAVQPLDQSLQRAERERRIGLQPQIGDAVADLIARGAGGPALPFRIGYPVQAGAPSPRRPVSNVIRAA